MSYYILELNVFVEYFCIPAYCARITLSYSDWNIDCSPARKYSDVANDEFEYRYYLFESLSGHQAYVIKLHIVKMKTIMLSLDV